MLCVSMPCQSKKEGTITHQPWCAIIHRPEAEAQQVSSEQHHGILAYMRACKCSTAINQQLPTHQDAEHK